MSRNEPRHPAAELGGEPLAAGSGHRMGKATRQGSPMSSERRVLSKCSVSGVPDRNRLLSGDGFGEVRPSALATASAGVERLGFGVRRRRGEPRE